MKRMRQRVVTLFDRMVAVPGVIGFLYLVEILG
jgi:hypothetical protein